MTQTNLFDASKTQKQRVLEQLQATGIVNNFWAIENYILRLAAVIASLKKNGHKIYSLDGRTRWGGDIAHKSDWKNCYYYLCKNGC